MYKPSTTPASSSSSTLDSSIHQADIEDYALIGNCHTAALVGIHGSIDYCCFPQFDSPPLFSKLISASTPETCGFFSIHPLRIEDTTNKQHYFPDSNVLVTKFLLSEGVGQVVDFMPLARAKHSSGSEGGKPRGGTPTTTLHTTKPVTNVVSSTEDLPCADECCPITKLFRGEQVNLMRGKVSSSATMREDLHHDDDDALFNQMISDSIIRRLEIVHGHIDFRVECTPVFNYGREKHTVQISQDRKCVVFTAEESGHKLVLQCNRACFEKTTENGHGIVGSLELSELDVEKSCVFLLSYIEKDQQEEISTTGEGDSMVDTKGDKYCKILPGLVNKTNQLAVETITFWQNYIKKSEYQGIFREQVNRSLLALKLLMYEKTGAIISSPSTSLPKVIGGERNYDYRYFWMRDATFAINAFLQTAMIDDAAKIIGFIERVINWENEQNMKRDNTEDVPSIVAEEAQVSDIDIVTTGNSKVSAMRAPIHNIYTIEGKPLDHVEEISTFSGFRNSRPVRVGNMATQNIELDIYGELMDAILLYDAKRPISYDLWLKLRKMVEFVIVNWKNPDHSIWEKTSAHAHYVYSKVMAWCCLDRAIRLAERRSFPAPIQHWLLTRNEIYEDIMKKGYNEKLGSFVQSYGSNALDVSLLIMPLVNFLSISDPRMINTIATIDRKPKEGGLVSSSLVYRNKDIHHQDKTTRFTEGTYNMFSFWLLRVLTLMGDRDKKKLRQAQLMFEKISTFSNHVDLFSEITSFTGNMLGNFIHCNTHASLIVAAVELSKRIK
ncbi:hypothetical protein C9374_013227 [Naegleria lovaniensis]|uniref:Glycoside hydrolase family 15 protein n=1 Tax=Naegleria lovaniensis TaxID=51637 RepID=A0AA88H1T5_NAELO|nr:uncharacterized protein C9374_013227 [Naegleria lovaniensis]KAG2391742.1 hypothetical protein C9374_013227 [Naegleria lovaniensis]